MNTHADQIQNNKSQSVANAVSQKQTSGESTFQFVDNRPVALAQRKLQEVANSQQSGSIQMMKFGRAPRFQETFTSGTGLQGIVLGNKSKSSVRKKTPKEKELPSESKFIYPEEQELHSELQFLNPNEQLLRIQQTGANIRQTDSMDCDRWARDFQSALDDMKVTYKAVKFMIRENKGRNAQGARIDFKGKTIGYDTHFFTVVTIGSEEIVFDNLNPQGINRNIHFGMLSFYLMNNELSDRFETVHRKVSFDENVIVTES